MMSTLSGMRGRTLGAVLALWGMAGCYASHGRGSTADAGPVDPPVPVDAPRDDAPRDDTPAPLPECPVLPPQPSPSDRVGLLSWLQQAIIGRWGGSRTSPWEPTPMSVLLEFFPDGTYEARCEPARDLCGPLYWGDDLVRGPGARYVLIDTNASGMGEGRLTAVFSGEAAWEGDIEVLIDGTGAELRMRFVGPDDRGPIVFTLERICE